jgi:preprotein translocase subunit YajC
MGRPTLGLLTAHFPCSHARIQSAFACAKPRFAAGHPPTEELLVFISSAFAQSAPAAAGGGDIGSSLMSMLPLLLMFVVLYFVMIRPQMKRQKEHKAMIDALAKGDEVATVGGLLGKISRIGDTTLGLELATGVEVNLQRSAVVQVLPKGTIK